MNFATREKGFLLASLLVPLIFGFSIQSQAIMCGVDECDVAGTVNGSPLAVSEFGDFATSVDAVSPTASGESYAHAWNFQLSEAAHISGTLTKDNTLDNFAQNPVFLQLFNQTDLETAIGATYFVPVDGDSNPFVNYRYANLMPGDYIFKVAGTLIGEDGQYSSQMAVSEVPLPPAIWLFVTAVLGLTTIVRRKRTSVSV